MVNLGVLEYSGFLEVFTVTINTKGGQKEGRKKGRERKGRREEGTGFTLGF